MDPYYMDRVKLERNEDWRKVIDGIPAIKFDPGWSVRVIPPFGGAMARFQVEGDGRTASVYLDTLGRLGYFHGPYWEVYPHGGDVGRVAMADADALVAMIRESLAGS